MGIADGIKELFNRISRTYEAGDYDKITITGMGSLNGPITAKQINVSGSCQASDSVKSQAISISGAMSSDGEIECGKLSLSGALNCQEGLKCSEKLSVSGSMKIYGKLKCNIASINGLVQASNIECEKMNVDGVIRCPNEVNCEEFIFSGIGKIEELHAEHVEICKDGKNGSKRVVININGKKFTKNMDFDVDFEEEFEEDLEKSIDDAVKYGKDKPLIKTIECTTAYIESIRCKKLCCQEAIIGEYADIEEMEYSRKIEVHPKAKVLKVTKV